MSSRAMASVWVELKVIGRRVWLRAWLIGWTVVGEACEASAVVIIVVSCCCAVMWRARSALGCGGIG
jgi:hypothetical protein